MAITVQHGPNLSRYASVMAQSAKQTENYGRMKDIAEFMQQVKQGNREYELGKEQNRLTGRGQDIQYDLGLKDVDLRKRGLDLQEVDQNRMYELGLREQDLAELTQQQGYELGLLKINQDASLTREGYFMQKPQAAMNLYGADPVRRDSN